ncbi:MFS transporter [Biostraticola tofi]|uniref:Cyanate permease n=1 Tax=Biostraticola tofi TaxID=466109 RepID=A0A4R3Z242_9GAMM|nr:MFS transporter [Biostraticola tofi]TCV99841.1 cyanate permease [Biostraticola tofi]
MSSSPDRFGPHYPWVMLLLFGMLYFLATATTFTSLGVVLPAMIGDLGWSWTDAGLGFTLLGLACGLSSYLPAISIRKLGVRLTLLLGTLLFIAGFGSLYGAQSIASYFIGTTLLGIGFSFLATVPGTYVISRLFVKQPLAFGIYFTIGGLGGVAGPWIYFLAQGFWGDWRMHWIISGTLLTLVSLLTVVMMREGGRELAHAEQVSQVQVSQAPGAIYRTVEIWNARQALRTRQFYVIAAAYTSFLLCGITVNSFAVAHITENGFSATVAATLLSVQAFINAFSRFAGGAVGEWLDPKKLLVGSLSMIICGMIALSAASSWPVLMLFTLCIGGGYGLTFLASSVLLSNYFGRRPYLELFSAMNLISTLACFAPFLAGAIKDHSGNFSSAFLIIALPVAAILLLTLKMSPPSHSASQ